MNTAAEDALMLIFEKIEEALRYIEQAGRSSEP